MSRTLPHSYDIFHRFYLQSVALIEDRQKLRDISKSEKWDITLDFNDLLLFKRNAVVILDANDGVLFKSSNYDSFFMVEKERYNVVNKDSKEWRRLVIYRGK